MFVQYPCPALSALPFLERLASYYCPSRGVLQLLKITSSLLLPQEQLATCCLPWGQHHEEPAHLSWQNLLPSVRKKPAAWPCPFSRVRFPTLSACGCLLFCSAAVMCLSVPCALPWSISSHLYCLHCCVLPQPLLF